MPFFSADQPLTLPELAEALRSRSALRLPPDADTRLRASFGEPPSLQPAGPDAVTSADWLLAYTCGVGPELPASLVRRMLLLLAQRLSTSSSGAQLAAAKRLLDFYHRDVWPVVYAQGAFGATDAVPLAHLCLPLLGLGEVDYQGYRLAAADVLGLFGWEALSLPEPAGRALLAGQEFTLAYATEALERAGHLLAAADTIAGLVTAGSTAENAAASRTAVAYVAQAVQTAGNATATTPAPPLALVLDHLAAAVAALGSLSALRTSQQLAGTQGLPVALAPPTLPGLPVLAHTAASLASQNQQLGTLAAGAAAQAAVRARQVVENTEQLLGIELLVAAQALGLRSAASPAAAAVVAAFREVVTFVDRARVLAPDLHRAARFVREYHWA